MAVAGQSRVQGKQTDHLTLRERDDSSGLHRTCHCEPPRAGLLNVRQLDTKGFTGKKESVESSEFDSLETLSLRPRPVSIKVHTEGEIYIARGRPRT